MSPNRLQIASGERLCSCVDGGDSTNLHNFLQIKCLSYSSN